MKMMYETPEMRISIFESRSVIVASEEIEDNTDVTISSKKPIDGVED